MTTEIPTNSPEKREALDDNARKFITAPLDDSFFDDEEVTSFNLVVDWLETDEASEKKLAYKTYKDGKKQVLLISKVTQAGGNRRTVKEPLTNERYREMLVDSMLHLEKSRHEFRVAQNGVEYDIKYDVFADGKLYMLEVDASDDHSRAAFDREDFLSELVEVTGNMDYYGYRICGVL